MIHIAEGGPKHDDYNYPQTIAPKMSLLHHCLAHLLDQHTHIMMVVQYT